MARNAGPSAPSRDDADNALLQALQKGDDEAARSLLKAYPDLARGKVLGKTPLVEAVFMTSMPGEGRVKIVQLLLDNGADPNVQGKMGKPLVQEALMRGGTSEAVALMLLEKGAGGPGVLHEAIRSGNVKATEFLLKRGEQPTDEDRRVALNPAVQKLLGGSVSASSDPETEVAAGTRVMEQGKRIRVKPVVPVSGELPQALRPVVDRLLTFDPHESQLTWHGRFARDVATLLAQRPDALEPVVSTYRRLRLVGPDGLLVLSHFKCALDTALEKESLEALVERLQGWVQASPDSTTARFALGKYLNAWAWRTSAGKDELLQRAESVLQGAQEPDPEVYAEMITSAYSLGHPEQMRALVDKAWSFAPGATVNALDYYVAYLEDDQLPGALHELEAKTRPEFGRGLYAVLAQRNSARLEWKDMRQGFQDYLQRRPHAEHYWVIYRETAKAVGDNQALAESVRMAKAPGNPLRLSESELAELK